MDTAQSAMKKEAFDGVVPAQLWFDDLPPYLSNLHPHSPANKGAFARACEQACSDAELDVVGWEEAARWLALGWDNEEEYRHDMHFRFAIDELMYSPAWAELAPQEREALDERVHVADTVYRRRSTMQTQVIDLLLPFPSATDPSARDKALALWRSQAKRFWFVWVEPLGLKKLDSANDD
jgi:hypothetical protein